MLNFRPILLVIGTLMVILSIAMLIPAVADVMTLDADWHAFVAASFCTAFLGGALVLTNRGRTRTDLNLKQAFVLTTMSWLALVAFAALPFYFSTMNISLADAFFEAMSGLTTTGATVMTGLDDMPAGILLWRAILQWLGGIGIIVMAMAILPMLKIGGMQLFRAESSDNADKVLPRITQVCTAISGIYLFFTVCCGFALWIAGMSAFDALCHAMTTIATGGFSTHDASIAYFNSQAIETIMLLGMIGSGIPFVLYIQFLQGRTHALWQDTQVHWFLVLLVISIVAVALWLIYGMHVSPEAAFRQAAFNVVSITTTSGFVSADYNLWGDFAVVFMFVVAVVGGCTGSTTGGIKIFRYQVLYETAKAQVNQLIHPHGVFRPIYNHKLLTESATNSVMGFIILFAFCFTIVAVLLGLTGQDFMTSMSGAASMLANVGPGLGDTIGPAGNYSSLPNSAKWLLSIAMLVGRLEIYTVLVLFSPYFWRS